MNFTRNIDNQIYSRKALAVVREAYSKYCTTQIVPLANGEAAVTVHIKNEYFDDGRQVFLEFWNYFLDISCKQKIESS